VHDDKVVPVHEHDKKAAPVPVDNDGVRPIHAVDHMQNK